QSHSVQLRTDIAGCRAGAVDNCAGFPGDAELDFLSGAGQNSEAVVPSNSIGVEIQKSFQTRQSWMLLEDVGCVQGVRVVVNSKRSAHRKGAAKGVADCSH